MSCLNAAGTITSGPLLDVSITDRSAALPTAVPGVLLLCEHFMARNILCFHITDKFVLSLSHWPLSDSLNDVVRPEELTLLRSNLWGWGSILVRMCTKTGHFCDTHIATCAKACKHTHTHTHLSSQWLTYQVKRTGFLWGGWGGWWLDQIHIYESYILPKHIVVIYNRYRLAASRTLNINVKRIYDERDKFYAR